VKATLKANGGIKFEATPTPKHPDWAWFWSFKISSGKFYNPGDYASGQTASQQFPSKGPHRVWLMVSDKQGCESWFPYDVDASKATITDVARDAPKVSSVNLDLGKGLLGTLTAELDNPDDLSLFYKWTLPDGSISYAEGPEFDFSETGTGTESVQVEVSVGPPPCAPSSSGTFDVEVVRPWIEHSGPVHPSARAWHAMGAIKSKKQIVLFGGMNAKKTFGDTWVWEGSKGWAEVDTSHCASTPKPRHRHAMTWSPVDKAMLMFGGRAPNGAALDDTWLWDHKSGCWEQQDPEPAGSCPSGESYGPPPKRGLHALATDVEDEVILFGGIGESRFDDTWRWDGKGWCEESPKTRPSARSSHGMAYDEETEELVLFGGTEVSEGPTLGDEWVWNGSNWSMKSPSVPRVAKERP